MQWDWRSLCACGRHVCRACQLCPVCVWSSRCAVGRLCVVRCHWSQDRHRGDEACERSTDAATLRSLLREVVTLRFGWRQHGLGSWRSRLRAGFVRASSCHAPWCGQSLGSLGHAHPATLSLTRSRRTVTFAVHLRHVLRFVPRGYSPDEGTTEERNV